jgi:hypothetical protein
MEYTGLRVGLIEKILVYVAVRCGTELATNREAAPGFVVVNGDGEVSDDVSTVTHKNVRAVL